MTAGYEVSCLWDGMAISGANCALSPQVVRMGQSIYEGVSSVTG